MSHPLDAVSGKQTELRQTPRHNTPARPIGNAKNRAYDEITGQTDTVGTV